MNKNINPAKWMGLIVVMIGLVITIFLTIRYGSVGLVVGLVIFLVLLVLYVLWVRLVGLEITYVLLKKYHEEEEKDGDRFK